MPCIACQEAVGRGQVGDDVASGMSSLLCADGRGLHLVVGDGGKPSSRIHRLDRLGRLLPDRQYLVFRHRPHAAVHLHVALEHVVVVEILGVEVAAAEEVVALGIAL